MVDEPNERFVAAMIPTLFSASAEPEPVAGFTAIMAGLHRAGFRAMASSLAEADLRDVLPRVRAPTLLVYGDADVRAEPSVGEALRAAIPGSRLVILPGVGHMISVEAPGSSRSKPPAAVAQARVRHQHDRGVPKELFGLRRSWNREVVRPASPSSVGSAQ